MTNVGKNHKDPNHPKKPMQFIRIKGAPNLPTWRKVVWLAFGFAERLAYATG